jgi:hypothetical protein
LKRLVPCVAKPYAGGLWLQCFSCLKNYGLAGQPLFFMTRSSKWDPTKAFHYVYILVSQTDDKVHYSSITDHLNAPTRRAQTGGFFWTRVTARRTAEKNKADCSESAARQTSEEIHVRQRATLQANTSGGQGIFATLHSKLAIRAA